MSKILIVDDEQLSRVILKQITTSLGHEAVVVENGEKAIERLKQMKFDIILTDFSMPKMNGFELTKKALEIDAGLIVILITAYGTIKDAVEAIKLGAFDYLTKPVNKDELELAIKRALERISLVKEVTLLRQKIAKDEPELEYLTENNDIKKILNEAVKLGDSDSTILITGESGTGKEYLARFIHKNSPRANNQFVVVSCSSIPGQVLESQLFGHVKGAFDDAHEDHKGYLEMADDGTIFLDNISELDPQLQLKLVSVLQNKQFTRVGDDKVVSTNARIIAASSKNLQDLIKEGKFREDLYYILNVFEFHLPALKDRPEDIILYFLKFVNDFGKKNNKKIKEISPEIKSALLNYEWPGNIRELKNTAERVTILCESGKITADLLPDKMFITDGDVEDSDILLTNDFNENKKEIIKQFEKKFISKFLKLNRGNVTATAREINYHPVTLRQKIITLGINPKDFKKKLN